MPTAVGPNTKGEENLVFGYDLGDVSNSYIGTPTKNQFGYQLSNGYLTSPAPVRANQNTSAASNSWGHWGPSGTIGNYGSNTDRNFIYFDEYNYSHWFEATAASPNPYLFYQVLPFEGQQFGAVDPSWGGGNPNNNPRTMTFILKLHDASEITNAKVSPTWNAHVSYYPTPTSSNTSPNQSTPWTSVTSLGDGWYKCVAANFVQSGANDLTGIWVKPGYKCYVGFAQQEEHPFPTALTDGTRSATEGLKDLTGNSTIDLTNVSFDSNAQMTFDGTDDYINISPNRRLTPEEPWTVELVFKPTNAADTSWNGLFGGYLGGGGYWMFHNGGKLTYYEGYSGGSLIRYSTWDMSNTFTVNTYHHLVITYTPTSSTSGTYVTYYNGGEKVDSFNWTLTFGYSLEWKFIGSGDGSRHGTNDVAYAKLYNRALTASEIKSNYNAIKGRFNI